MKRRIYKKSASIILILFFLLSSCIPVLGSPDKTMYDSKEESTNVNIKYIKINLSFSYPEIVKHGNYSVIRINETNHNQYVYNEKDPGRPVLPVNISIFNLMFGSRVINITYEHSTPQTINLTTRLSFCKTSYDTTIYGNEEIMMDTTIYESDELYPSDWVLNHTGGGLWDDNHTTFLGVRVYPVRYIPLKNQIKFIQNISVNISYVEPSYPILGDNDQYDLLIIAPFRFKLPLNFLVNHKNKLGVRTKLVTLNFIYNKISDGRDKAEKIKLYIKESIENAGIKYVLLVGGHKNQRLKWHLPVRYSRVLPFNKFGIDEHPYLSDLYFADIYFGDGRFSSWDSNGDNIFSVWNDTFKEEMDLYPDVYLGRLPCRNRREVRIMVNKIINYEKNNLLDEDWFNNFILVAGDSYDDENCCNEGELITKKAIELMPGFNPVRIYARDNESRDTDRKTINSAMKEGAGFAYFCGHGSPWSWFTYFPPDCKNESCHYRLVDMLFLRNKGKMPITVVGGCQNGQFDVCSLYFLRDINYFILHEAWSPRCWSWYLTVKKNGGAIATISNTGIGAHGNNDMDNNSIPDYLEILDGWLELRFFELFGKEDKTILGENHVYTLTEYLNKFLGDNHDTDVKMVQQWQLFGDPSLKIGGYEKTA